MVLGEPTLIHISTALAHGEDPRAFRAAAKAGHYVRIRRGIYAEANEWSAADDRARHVARVRAVLSQLRSTATVAAGYSAAAVHGINVLRRFPDTVTLLAPYRGGGTAEPGVVRTSARWCADHATRVSGFAVTCLERTVFDIVLADGFDAGVATLDQVLRTGTLRRDELRAFLADWKPQTGAARMRAALEFADAASESFGESMARAAMHRAGFVSPVLQAIFRDEVGEIRTDFFWPEHGVVAEFDGQVKFANDAFSDGDPARVLWREKLREDRLRRQVRSVVRLTWDDIRDVRRMARLLDEAGVPRLGHRSRLQDTGARVSFAP